MTETDVMIAGGGPIGLTLGLVLAHYGIDCFVAERNATTTRHPKMDVTNCRSMEIYRRLGIADRLRAAAVPADHNMDVSWITHMSGHEIYRFRYPSVTEARELIRDGNDGSQPLEPNMRISQVLLEPLLRDLLVERPRATVRYGWTVDGFTQDDGGVVTAIRNGATGAVERVRSRYLIGCDGAASVVRRALGIGLEGEAGVRARYMVHFRSDARDILQRWGIAWHYQSPPHGVLICQDDREIWTLQAVIPDGVDPDDADPADLLEKFLGTRIEAEILQANHWVAHLLLAESYGAGRVFLAGDSAHQYIPTGGYGMNTGVGDAFDLGWKLAAVLRGWGGDRLLESYETERRPVGLRNREQSRAHSDTKGRVARLWQPGLDDPGPDGDRIRAEVAAGIAEIGNAENESLGIELGYRYDGSPIVCPEDGTPPPLEPLRYRPSTWPGTRIPSLFLADGRAVHDLLGDGFTLLNFGGAPVAAVEQAAARRGMPLKTVRIEDDHASRVFERALVLVRPDGHVAWRADVVPDNNGPDGVGALLDRVRGRGAFSA